MDIKGKKNRGLVALLTFTLAAVVNFSQFFTQKAHAIVSPLQLAQLMLTMGQDVLDTICEPTAVIYRKIMTDQPQSSIVRTHYFLTAAGPLNFLYSQLGTSIDHIPRCIPFNIGTTINSWCEAGSFPADITQLVGGPLYDNCGPFFGSINVPGLNPETNPDVSDKYYPSPDKPAAQYSAGIFGILQALYDANTFTKPPVSMTLAWNDSFGDMYVFGKALAADPLPGSFSDPFSEEILLAWKVVRNIAFGLLALYMFYVGILIMTRKHVDQRTVVTIQYALPKLVLAVLLITFSYAIGVVFAQVAWYVSHHAREIVKSAFESTTAPIVPGTFVLNLTFIGFIAIYVLFSVLLAVITGGITLLPTIIIFVVVVGGVMIAIEIKIFVTYLKILTGIITAPIEFLIYSIPGSQKPVTQWFRKMTAYTVGMISIRGVLWFTLYISTICGYGFFCK